jgi:hypothetical protein
VAQLQEILLTLRGLWRRDKRGLSVKPTQHSFSLRTASRQRSQTTHPRIRLQAPWLTAVL